MATQYQRAINVATTDAGALAGAAGGLGPGKDVYGQTFKAANLGADGALFQYPASEAAKAIVYWARNVARVFINRAATAFLYATAVLSFLAFLTTLSSDTADSRSKRYLCALSVVINMVAVAHYKIIVRIRSYDFGTGAAEGFKTFDVGPFSKWKPFLGIGIEMAVDAVRHSDWLVRRNKFQPKHSFDRACACAQITLVFLIHKLYALAGTDADGKPRMGDVFETVEGAVFCAVIMILLSVFVRVGTDEVWDLAKSLKTSTCFVPIVAICAWIGSVVIMILILIDIDTAVENNKAATNVELYRSFYLIWIGYPIVSLFGWGARLWMGCMYTSTYNGETPEWVSLIKDVCYVLLDTWSKGAFAMWTAYAAFGVHFFQSNGVPLAR